MADTIEELYGSFSQQMEPIQAEDRYFRYLFELAQASDTTLEQKREELVKVVDEEWISRIEDTLDAINAIIEKPRRFITTEEEVVPVSLAKKISADSVRHLSQNTQFLAPSDDGRVHPTKILNVNTVETYDLYENRFIYHLIQRLLTFVDKRTDVIFWSTGNEVRNRFKMHSSIGDAYEEIEYNVEMTVKNRQSFAENDADNIDVFMRIDRVRRLVAALRGSSFCSLMAGCSAVRSPIQRTNLIMKDPNYRKCYELWQFMERYDEVGYDIDVRESALAFDDEYMVQMYTNLINNYAVFKSLISDDRNIEELSSVRHEPVKPKFVKEIREELVDSPDIPDVEVRRVFVEEVTQAQLDAEEALAKEHSDNEALRTQLSEWSVRLRALTDERNGLQDAIGAAKKREEEHAKRIEELEFDSLRMQGELSEAHAACKAATEDAQAARDEAQAQVSATRTWADGVVAAARSEADEALASAKRDSDEALASAKREADAAILEAQRAAQEKIDAACEGAAQLVADARGAQAQAEREARAAEEALDCGLRGAEEEHAAKVREIEDAHAAERERLALDSAAARESAVRAARTEMQRELDKANSRLEDALARLERCERALAHAERRAEGNSLSRYVLRMLRGDAESSMPGDAMPNTHAQDAHAAERASSTGADDAPSPSREVDARKGGE